MTRPTALIEDWLPFDAIGVESLREGGFPTPFPGPVRLHVWWARRPLMVSRAAVVASLLPAYEAVAQDADLRQRFPSEEAYRAWFTRLIGIRGDPVKGREELRRATELNITLGKDAYGGAPRAFTVNPAAEDLALLAHILDVFWKGQEQDLGQYTILDPFAGGGSIPFKARRYGLGTIANELNPVAAVVLKATVDYPLRFGPGLATDIRKWGREWSRRVREKLARFYPNQPNDHKPTYLWARTVACPVSGKPVPLSPNWWLSKKRVPVAARLLTDPAWDEPRFEIVSGDAIDFDPDEGTVSRGVGRSPWTGDPIDGDYIKAEAQAGRMGQMLYAIANKSPGKPDFRVPTQKDRDGAHDAEIELYGKRSLWETQDFIPSEPIPDGLKTPEPMRYGMYTWADMFSPRQFLALGTFVEVLHELRGEIHAAMVPERATAVETYLSIMLDKAIIYNNRLCRFDPSRGIRSVFDRHDFAFVWSHGEFDACADLLPWAISQVVSAYRDIAKLLAPSQQVLGASPGLTGLAPLTMLQGSAADLSALPDGSVHVIVTDPPYYDNVMYAELSDFFYVWLKRTVGHLYPEWFAAQLTDKDAEAVANPARFAGLGRKKTALAEQDYQRKMEAAFREMHRVLADNGVLTVMFTHKRVEAWDTLASALINAGFSVQSSWPVHTESEHSLHQAKKNAAQSTILLACRKRAEGTQDGAPVWWDDIAPRCGMLPARRQPSSPSGASAAWTYT